MSCACRALKCLCLCSNHRGRRQAPFFLVFYWYRTAQLCQRADVDLVTVLKSAPLVRYHPYTPGGTEHQKNYLISCTSDTTRPAVKEDNVTPGKNTTKLEVTKKNPHFSKNRKCQRTTTKGESMEGVWQFLTVSAVMKVFGINKELHDKEPPASHSQLECLRNFSDEQARKILL